MIDINLQSIGALTYLLLALSFSSFLGVVMTRLSNQVPLLGRSHCDSCGENVPWRFNIPILGWLFLRGRCNNCHAKIPIEIFLIELLGLVLYSMVWFKFPQTSELLLWFTYCSFGLPLLFIDIRHLRLPNALTYPFFIVILILVTYHEKTSSFSTLPWNSFALAAANFLFYSLLRLISRGGLGLGDVKLAPTIGLICGSYSTSLLIYSTYVTFMTAGFVAIVLLVARKAHRKTAIPLGPFMIAAPLLMQFML